jgi:hypoxanthine phosphoribosyltransferase
MSEINNLSEQIFINNHLFVPYIREDEIKARIKEIADQISTDYNGKTPVFIGVLNGSFIFMSDLIKDVTIDCEIDFFKLSSYGDEKISSGRVKLIKN